MIYRLDDQIAQALESAYDPFTGELLEGVTEEELFNLIQTVTEDFENLIDNIICEVKNLKAEAADIKEEKMKLQERQSKVEKRYERTKRLLAYLLNGERFKNGRHSISYRKSTELVLDDNFIPWAEINAPGLLNWKDPEPAKNEIRNAIKEGTYFEFAHLEEKTNIQIK